ncbi:MAG: Bug family tripartite tricarboxylate transporter substrate binding protein [Burkholderiales bacterium]|jgi:tripartite-type tricarboxylate transporter receptor subunit TctC
MRFRVLLASLLLSTQAGAQNYPEKTVTMVVAFPAGGSADLIARSIAEHMTTSWKQNVLVVNRAGASGNIGTESVVRAAADGHTLLYGTTALASSPAVYPKLGYNVLTDLAPVGLIVNQANVLVVHPSLPAKSVRELIALDRAHPKTLNSASAGVGSSNHLALVLFNMLSGANVGHIPYKGAAPAVAETMGGHVHMTFAPVAAAVPPVQAGKLRALGISSTKRSKTLPDVPTINEGGVPGYEAGGWNAMLAPANTPRDVVLKINQAVHAALATPRTQDLLAKSGTEPVTGTPEEFGSFLKSEVVKWGKVVKAAGLVLQ